MVNLTIITRAHTILGTVVNLAKDPVRSIARSVPKQQLSPAVTEYLNLHRWTGYFIESSLKALKNPEAS